MFTKEAEVDPDVDIAMERFVWTGELDCARKVLALGGKSFSHDKHSNSCVVYRDSIGSYRQIK